MPFSPSDSLLFAPLFSDPALAAIFSDEEFVRRMLEVEAALARVEGELGVIPAEAGRRISASVPGLTINLERLRAGVETDGFPVVELIKQIRTGVGKDAAYVHWGATTQDIMDTALILQLRDAVGVLEGHLAELIAALAALAARHRNTLMAGRTHSQQALPISFGFKAANWLAPFLRHRKRLAELKPRLLVVQFGGAVGTLAALSGDGLAVQQGLADELKLSVLPMPWHTQRDNLVEFAGWVSLISGSLAKIAQDIILMAQTEVAELSEAADRTHGGSSTMPQKSNPIISETVIAAARVTASLLAAMHQAQIQEHERATGSWQTEWLALPQMVGLAAGALQRTLLLSKNLVVDEARMQRNVQASNGLMLAERLSFELARSLGRAEAEQLVRSACQTAIQQDRHLVDVLSEQTTAALDWASLRNEAGYLGAAQAFIDRVVKEAAA